MTKPSISRLKVKVRLSASVAAANWVAPRRPISSTSVAWIACWVRLARISGQASASVARNSSRHAPAPFVCRNIRRSIESSLRGARAAKQSRNEQSFVRSARNGAPELASEKIASEARMKFVRAIWKLLVGIKDALVLFLMIIFFGGLYGALSARPAPIRDGSPRSQPQRQPGRATGAAPMGRRRQLVLASSKYRLRDLVAALDKAKDDSRVKAVALDLDGFTGGGADRCRRPCSRGSARARGGQAGGRLWDRLHGRELCSLPTSASEIWLNPLGASVDHGPGGSNLYYKGLLDKLGVTANVYGVGTYKSAVEPEHSQ